MRSHYKVNVACLFPRNIDSFQHNSCLSHVKDCIVVEMGLLEFPNHSCPLPLYCGFGDLRSAAWVPAVQASDMLHITPTASAACFQKVKCLINRLANLICWTSLIFGMTETIGTLMYPCLTVDVLWISLECSYINWSLLVPIVSAVVLVTAVLARAWHTAAELVQDSSSFSGQWCCCRLKFIFRIVTLYH
jgi:hypothetical protein